MRTDLARQMNDRAARPRAGAPSVRHRRGRGFTLLEWLVCIIIIGILASIVTLVFRGAAESSVMAQARNAVITYAQVARSYAIANRIETMLVVNPFNGRFEVWRANPPADGGDWDPLSSGTAAAGPRYTDGYTFAAILDPSARLPRQPNGEPAAAVNPIDYDNLSRPAPAATDSPEMDNLTWAAFCFDETGQLVIRTRRIATRTFYLRDRVTPRAASARNRLSDETPDLTLPNLSASPKIPLVDQSDSPITSTRGFVISDLPKKKLALSAAGAGPQKLVNNWLMLTRPGQPYQHLAQTIVLNRFSGQQLTGAP